MKPDDALTPNERELLAELLSTGRPSDDPAVQRALSGNPVLAREYDELQRIAAALDDSGSEQRHTVTEAVQGTTPADVQLAHEFVRRHEHELGGRRRWWLVPAAAVALIGLAFLARTWWPSGAPARDDPYLNTEGERKASPSGRASFAHFSWPAVPGADAYRLKIYAAANGRLLPGAPVIDRELTKNEWTPTTEELANLQRLGSIAWSVAYTEAGGGEHPLLRQVLAESAH